MLRKIGFCVVLAGWIASAGCRNKTEIRPTAGARLLFQVDAPREGSTQFDAPRITRGTQAMVEAVRLRLEAAGAKGAEVNGEEGGRIRVVLPGASEAEASRVQEQISRPTRLAFSVIEPGGEFFQGLQEKFPTGGEVWVASDSYSRGDAEAEAREFCLMAHDRAKLQAALAGLVAPAGHRLWILPGRSGASAAYLVKDPPEMEHPEFTESRVVRDPEFDRPQVRLSFAEPHRKAFAELTRKYLHRRLAILLGPDIISTPVVQSPIEGGQVSLDPSPLPSSEMSEQEALALAASIKAWGLSGGLTLLEREVTPTGK